MIKQMTTVEPQAKARANCVRICITPTRNESWIIRSFLAAARTWADHVIVADQGSTDGTLESIQGIPKVHPVINEEAAFGEAHRQNLLINRAREIEGTRVLFALDADEALSANCTQSPEWEAIARARPGTVLRFRWVNILPGFQKAWILPEHVPLGFVDDGSVHESGQIHCRRVPWPKDAPVLDLEDIVVLHFQYVLPERVASKHRWYQAWEQLNRPERGALAIFRQYHHMHGSWGEGEIAPIERRWIEAYDKAGIDFRSVKTEPVMWWDREMLSILREHGTTKFRKLAIWDKDWSAYAESLGMHGVNLADPRNAAEKFIHRLLLKTQPYRQTMGVRLFERALRIIGW
jgi:hypothetical protein